MVKHDQSQQVSSQLGAVFPCMLTDVGNLRSIEVNKKTFFMPKSSEMEEREIKKLVNLEIGKQY